jgi:hypothetical protein
VRSSIAAEVRQLASEETDREQMRIVRDQLADLAPRLAESIVRGERFRLPAPRAILGDDSARLAALSFKPSAEHD